MLGRLGTVKAKISRIAGDETIRKRMIEPGGNSTKDDPQALAIKAKKVSSGIERLSTTRHLARRSVAWKSVGGLASVAER